MWLRSATRAKSRARPQWTGARGGLLERFSLTGAPAVEEPEDGDDDGGFEGKPEEGVGDAAMMLKGGDGTVERPEDVEVGGFGGDGHGDCGVGSLAIEPRAGEAGSGQQMGDWFHV